MGQLKISILKYKWIIAGFLLLTIVTSAAFSKEKIQMKVDEDDYIAKINGIPINVAEYNRAIRMNKPNIMNYFRDKYNAELTTQFWSTSFDGEVPAEVLKEKALDESVKIKVRQMIAKELGVLQDISYQGFVHQLDQENARRAKAIENHQVVYGPAQYDEEAYFEYVLTNSMISVKQNMQMNSNKPDEQMLKGFYNTHKDELYSTPGMVKVQRISISFLDSNDHADVIKKEQAKKEMEMVNAELASGASFMDLAEAFMDKDVEKELIFNLGNDRQNARSPLAQASLKLTVQEKSSIIEENGSYNIVKCIEKIEPGSGYKAYEETKEQVLNDYIDNKYEERIRQKLSEAQIVLNESSYQSWKITE